jgi:signal peptidase I
MAQLTGALFVALAAYVFMLVTGKIIGNFALLLFTLTVMTGLYWLAERFYFLPQRRVAADRASNEIAARQAKAASEGIKLDTINVDDVRASLLRQPWWLEWTAGLFGVIAVVFLLRSFVAEPFRVPSGSMLPTIQIGDLILVNKFTYGVRLPVVNVKIVDNNSPKRGDIMVFRLPKDPRIDYIKRVVGEPGDTISYLNKKLSINGVEQSLVPQLDYLDDDSMQYNRQFEEKFGDAPHKILTNDAAPAFMMGVEEFPDKANCTYSAQGVVCKVPAGHYFMMGDNRDNSLDSRFWGFVPEANIVGRAFFVWFNLSAKFKRIGALH